MLNGNATTDGSWRASGWPVSTIARSFSAALDEAFFMKPDLDNLSQSVAQKQQSVSTQKSELEELEARLRATEARLQTQQASDSSSTNRNDFDNNKDARSRNGLERAFDPPLESTTRGHILPSSHQTREHCTTGLRAQERSSRPEGQDI